jgi:hypothetical protein
MQLSGLVLTSHSVSASVHDARCSSYWKVTWVYGPKGDLEKKIFMRELKGLNDGAPPAWLLMGDFNLISIARDKSNGRVNRAMINRFQKAINHK